VEGKDTGSVGQLRSPPRTADVTLLLLLLLLLLWRLYCHRPPLTCCAVSSPTPTVRSFQMRLSDSSSSSSSRRDENCSTAQHSTAQHSTAQHSTARHTRAVRVSAQKASIHLAQAGQTALQVRPYINDGVTLYRSQ